MIVIALLLQAQPAPPAEPDARSLKRFSILAERCAPLLRDGREVVVCGDDASISQRLPLPAEAVSENGKPSNPLVNGVGALAVEPTPCAARQAGCQVGFGPPVGLIAGAAIKGIGDAIKDRKWAKARARDGARRQLIDLDAAAPAGRIEP